jgi:hypothetical protein
MNAIFSSLGLGAKVEGSRKLSVDTATLEKNACDEIVSDDRRVMEDGVIRELISSVYQKRPLVAPCQM